MSGSGAKSMFPSYDSHEHGSSGYTLHSKIMIAAIVVLFAVILFVLALHIYAKWFWRRRYAASIRRRSRLDFAGQEASGVAGSIGLEKAAIDALPTFTYEPPQSEEEEVLECAVCLCEFKENEKGRLLPKCNHSFHIECIDMWFHSHSTCPLCRTRAVPDSTPDIPGAQEAASTESTAAILSQHVDSLWPTETPQQAQGTEHASSTSGGGNRGSISDRFQHDPGMGYPANALSWGDHSHVSSHMSSSVMEDGHPGARSLPHIAIGIPMRSESSLTPSCLSFNTPRRGASFSSLLCPSAEELPCSPHDQPLKSPSTRFNNLKRLLSRERKIPAAQHATGDCDQVGAFSNT